MKKTLSDGLHKPQKAFFVFYHVFLYKEHIKENSIIWNFSLSKEGMATISKMDIGHSEIIDYFSADTAKWLNSYKIHN